MVLEALQEHGEMTVEQLSRVTGKSEQAIEKEIDELWQEGKICMDKNGVCYIPPRTSFATMLLVVFLIFVCSWVLIGAI